MVCMVSEKERFYAASLNEVYGEILILLDFFLLF